MNYDVSIFISHAWDYSDHYSTLADWIFNTSWNVQQVPINFIDTSIPKHDPVHTNGTDYQLKAIIDSRIAQSNVIVIPTGVYASYRKWIQKEIDSSKAQGKPILAVNIWGAQKTSTVVADASNKLVGWNKKSVVTGIWELFRAPR
jgi:hypothetical protein